MEAIEEIIWTDIRGASGWIKWADVKTAPVEVRTVGYVKAEDDETVTLTAAIMGAMVHSPVSIPQRNIKSRTVIREAQPEAKQKEQA